MTPPSDYRKQSLMPDIQSNVIRSQSDTSYEGLASVMQDRRGRRCSEWAAQQQKMVLRPLQLNEADQKDHNGLLYRRLSSKSKTESSTVTRSYSMKSVKKLAEARQRHRGSSIPTESNKQYGVKVKERTVSNRSLPLPGEDSEYFRLRNFSVTSKGVINRGDSFRSKSDSNVEEEVTPQPKEDQPSPLREDAKEVNVQKKPFRVLLVGASGVGKSSMWKQFMTSEYICADDFGNGKF